MAKEVIHSYFKNGVRVDVLADPDFPTFLEGNSKTEGVIDRLTKIAGRLGGPWTVERGNGDGPYYHMLYNGGHKLSGITINLHNIYYWDEKKYQSRPDYWKFDCCGTYPQPQLYADQRRQDGAPRANINIDDPIRAAASIKSRLIPGITEMTASERLYVEQIKARNEGYQEWLQTLADCTGNKLNDEAMSTHEKNFHIAGVGGSIKVYRGSQAMHYAIMLQPDELDLLMQFNDRLGKLRSEKRAKAAQECNSPA